MYLTFISEIIWVILTVEENGLLGVTQQLSSFGAELSQQSPQKQSVPENPFASPRKSDSNAMGPFGSPSLSVVAQQGSIPNSPVTPYDANTPITNNISPSQHVRTALFPVSIMMLINKLVTHKCSQPLQ